MKYNDIAHYGDILAIPFFAILVNYFYKIKNKTFIEYILFLFYIAGVVLDSLFTVIFLYKIKYLIINNNLAHYADILAIPFFALSVNYFILLKNKSFLEYILLLFSIGCLIADILYSFIFLLKDLR